MRLEMVSPFLKNRLMFCDACIHTVAKKATGAVQPAHLMSGVGVMQTGI